MLAQRVEPDVAHQHISLMGVRTIGATLDRQVVRFAGDDLGVHVCHPARSIDQAAALRVFANGFKEKPDALLNLMPRP